MIGLFRDKYYFLSHFYPCRILYDGYFYSSVEPAFQAAKTWDLQKRAEIRKCATPGQAKRLGRTVELRPGWDDFRLDIMEELDTYKFTKHVELGYQLLQTGDEELVELNWWNDMFWGVDIKTGIGENHAGKILMRVRGKLKEKSA